MLAIDSQTVQAFLQTNWGWAAGLAASMLALTLLAGGLLNQERKDEISLWLMGAQSEDNWSRSFVSLFDAVFGGRHLSLRCFLRSAAASLIAVAAIWLLMGNFGRSGSASIPTCHSAASWRWRWWSTWWRTTSRCSRPASSSATCPAPASRRPWFSSSTDQAKLDFIMLACAGGVTEECLQRGLATYAVRPEEAARLWTRRV